MRATMLSALLLACGVGASLAFAPLADMSAAQSPVASRAFPIAQTPTSQQSSSFTCPRVSVSCPADDCGCGAKHTFNAEVTDAAPGQNLTYEWTVSTGKITGGESTASINVETGGSRLHSITVTVDLISNTGCVASNSITQTCLPAPAASLFDRYGDVPFDNETARLDRFVAELQNVRGAQGYLVVFAARGDVAGKDTQRSLRAKNYLVGKRGIEDARIVVVRGGEKTRAKIELWIVPAGATPPYQGTPDGEQPTPAGAKPRRF